MSSIDFKKVDAAFHHLANDATGQAHLADFSGALNKLKSSLSGLNDHEAQYVASSLLNQRSGVQSNIAQSGARVVHGFVIKSAVD